VLRAKNSREKKTPPESNSMKTTLISALVLTLTLFSTSARADNSEYAYPYDVLT
jgi:hypothetical protein